MQRLKMGVVMLSTSRIAEVFKPYYLKNNLRYKFDFLHENRRQIKKRQIDGMI